MCSSIQSLELFKVSFNDQTHMCWNLFESHRIKLITLQSAGCSKDSEFFSNQWKFKRQESVDCQFGTGLPRSRTKDPWPALEHAFVKIIELNAELISRNRILMNQMVLLYWIEWLCISTKLFRWLKNHKKIQKRKLPCGFFENMEKFISKINHFLWISNEITEPNYFLQKKG